MAKQVLVVDDEPQVRAFVREVLEGDGWEVSEADSAERASDLLKKTKWAAAFCDVILGGADGFSVLKLFKKDSPETKVVLMTGQGSGAGALDATALGAYDYLLKPFGIEELQAISRALREQLTDRKAPVASRTAAGALFESGIHLIGRSEVFVDVMKQVGRAAGTHLPVLLMGEPGTGKEVVASALHMRSSRSEHPFVAVNCGAIPADILEVELFGHAPGSVEGAHGKNGLWEDADGGTIFLDEITDTTSAFQVKLLRTIQQGEVRRVGSTSSRKVDVRVIAATHRDVDEEVRAGRFRQDLFYRLNAISIVLPPLRDRPEDIVTLALSFARDVYALSPAVQFSAEALALLKNYTWPGNIRELENAVVRAAAMGDGTIQAKDLPERVRNYANEAQGSATKSIEVVNDDETAEWPSLGDIEGRYVMRVLRHTNGNKQAAARLLRVDRKTLDRKIKRYKIPTKQ